MDEPIDKKKMEALLRAADHDRDMHFSVATITEISRPTPTILRFVASLSDGGDDPAWQSPNVTIRMELGEKYDEASRVYTIRSFDPQTQLIEVDVVVHGNTSPMMRWSGDLKIGSTFNFRGPRQHFIVPGEPDLDAVLFADGTAVPALYAILQQWPAGRRATGWIDTTDEAAFAELPTPEGVTLHRIETKPGDSVGAMVPYALGLESPQGYAVWAAGERDDMRAIRSHFRTTVGAPKENVAVFGYWKRGVNTTTIDIRRLEKYAEVINSGGALEDFDDFSIGV